MILGTGLLALGSLMIWTGLTGSNGFGELAKLLRGEEAFSRSKVVPDNVAGKGGSLTGEGGGGGGGGGGGAW